VVIYACTLHYFFWRVVLNTNNVIDNEKDLSSGEKEFYRKVISNSPKIASRIRFERRETHRRHDHGTRGNIGGLHSGDEQASTSAIIRRNFRAAGRQITGTF